MKKKFFLLNKFLLKKYFFYRAAQIFDEKWKENKQQCEIFENSWPSLIDKLIKASSSDLEELIIEGLVGRVKDYYQKTFYLNTNRMKKEILDVLKTPYLWLAFVELGTYSPALQLQRFSLKYIMPICPRVNNIIQDNNKRGRLFF